jgi:hemolysin III
MAGMNPQPTTPAPLALLSKIWSRPNFGGHACCPVSGQTPAEESVNVLTHGVGLLLSIAGLSLLVTLASFTGNPWNIVGSAIFGSTLVLVYAGSTLYHASPSTRRKRVWKVADECLIYLLIAGTYTPFVLGPLNAPWGWSILGLVWGIAVLGISGKILFPGRLRGASIALYLAQGWLILVAAVPTINSTPAGGIAWLLLGGLAYSGGIILLMWTKLPFNHGAWHLCVMAGSASHYFAVLFYLLPY